MSLALSNTTPAAPGGNTNVTWQADGLGHVSGYIPNTTSLSWSSLTNATTSLTLANGTNATTFNQTSAVSWTWANTTAATVSVSQSSPIITINGTYWTGSASATDSWTIQDVVGTGANGTSILTFAHSGTTGVAGVKLPSTAPTTVPAATLFDYNSASLCYSGAGGIFLTDTSVNFRLGFWDNSGAYKIAMASGGTIAWTASTTAANAGGDTGISRISAGLAGIGNGSQGDFTGSLQCNNITEKNGTAATSSVSQSSPTLTFSGNYWTGSASAADTWTVQNVLANGTNGASTLTFTHSGTTGTASVSFPGEVTSLNTNTNLPSFNCDGSGGIGRNGTGQAGMLLYTASNASNAFACLSSTGTTAPQFTLGSGTVCGWNSTASASGNAADTGFSRIAAAEVALGNGTVNDFSGTLKCGNIIAAVAGGGSGTFAEAATIQMYSNSGGIGVLVQESATDYLDIISGGVVKGLRGIGATTTPMIVGCASASLSLYSGTGTVFISGNASTPQGDSTGNLKLAKITGYNAETTAGNGVAYLRGVTSQKSETGADAALLSVTPAAAAGTYRIQVVLSVSAASVATLGWTAIWKDANGNAQAPTNLQINTPNVAAPALTVTAAANTQYFGEWIVDVDNSATAIVVQTTFTGTSIAYKATATVERIA